MTPGHPHGAAGDNHVPVFRAAKLAPALLASVLFWLLASAPASAVSCSISAGTLNLGFYTGALLTSGTNLGSVTCPTNFRYAIGLSAGSGKGATVTQRKMTGPGAAVLTYQLFQDSARGLNWGNTANIDAKPGVGTNGAQSFAIYSQIPANQAVTPGLYQDTVTASVLNSSPLATLPISIVVTVQAACTITATALAFGNYVNTQNDAVGTLTVTCTNTTPYNIGLSAGLAQGATIKARAMTGPGGGMLKYALSRDSVRSLNWGATVGSDTLVGQGTGRAIPVYVYGRVSAGQTVRPGAYADTVIATITY
jgi:spore coat protein U-like protein